MAEPRIQYAKTSDGVSIAFWAIGQGGTPLVIAPSLPGVIHIEEDWKLIGPGTYEPMAERRMLVRYDPRGAGLSDREITAFSLDAYMLDLEAVVDRLRLERFALLAHRHSGPVAIAYAARHPERTARLILWDSYAQADVYAQSPRARALRVLRDEDWETYTETAIYLASGYFASEIVRQFAASMRATMSQQAFNTAMAAIETFDVAGLLARVEAPTLVLHPREEKWLPVDVARRLASQIPNARLALLDEGYFSPWLVEAQAFWTAVDGFVAEGEHAAPQAGEELPSGTAVILFADIADSTALTERLGDAAFREKARELDEALRRAITSNGGTAIDGKLLGDGVLATFGAAREAIACAAELHEAGGRADLPLHIGIHAGDVIREEGNVFGGAVNIAARIASASAAGETLVSATVRDLARTSAGVSFEDRGDHELKGIEGTVRVFAVRRQEQT